MKRATLLVPILSVALALPVFAQAEREVKTGGKGKEETLKLMINGGLDVAFAYESGQLKETSRWTPGGFLNDEVDPNYFFNGPAWVQFLASLQDNVEVGITIRTVPYASQNGTGVQFGGQYPGFDRINWGSNGDTFLSDRVAVKYAWVKVKELFDPAWSLTVGQQDVIWDVRGRGNAFFLDAAHAESPWAEINRVWASTVRDEQDPVGFKLTYSRDQVTVELGIFPVLDDITNLRVAYLGGVPSNYGQQALYYLNGVFNFDNHGGKIGVIFTSMHGVTDGADVYTVGLSGVISPQKDIEIFAEGYYQFGQPWAAGKGDPLFGGTPTLDGQQSALAFLVGGRIDVPGDTAFMLEAHFLYVSGQSHGGQYSNATGYRNAFGLANLRESREFMSYENYNVMLLLNSAQWGYDFDNNIMQVDLQAAAMLSTGGAMKNNLHFKLGIGYAWAPQKWIIANPITGATVERTNYGYEIDVTIRWHMNKNANVFLSGGYLLGSDIIQEFSRARDQFAYILLFGVQASN